MKEQDLETMIIKGMAKDDAARMIAEKICEIHGEKLVKEISESITPSEIKEKVMDMLAERIIAEWKDSY